jgi:hypothetical protein
VEPRTAEGAMMSDGAKGPFYRSACIVEASGVGRPVVEFNFAGFKE